MRAEATPKQMVNRKVRAWMVAAVDLCEAIVRKQTPTQRPERIARTSSSLAAARLRGLNSANRPYSMAGATWAMGMASGGLGVGGMDMVWCGRA